MDVIKIHLGTEFDDTRDPMEQVMDDMLHLRRAFVPRSGSGWSPPTDLYETAGEIVILAEMAGLRSEEIQVVMDRETLKISGYRANPIHDPNRKVHQMELDFGPFERRVKFRVPVDPEGIQAVYRDGFLMIRVPKFPEFSREIRVR